MSIYSHAENIKAARYSINSVKFRDTISRFFDLNSSISINLKFFSRPTVSNLNDFVNSIRGIRYFSSREVSLSFSPYVFATPFPFTPGASQAFRRFYLENILKFIHSFCRSLTPLRY